MLVWMSSSAYFLSAQPRRLDEFFELTSSFRTKAHGCQQHENVGSAGFSLLSTKNYAYYTYMRAGRRHYTVSCIFPVNNSLVTGHTVQMLNHLISYKNEFNKTYTVMIYMPSA